MKLRLRGESRSGKGLPPVSLSMQIKGIPQWRHGSCELEVWEAVDVPVSRRSSRQMRTIRMPRGHLIDKCDLVRVSHMMLLSRTARRNLRKRGAEQTQYPWHFARPTSWQLTGDANYQDLLLADIELPNSSKIESWYNSPLQSIMLILRLDSIPFWFAYRSQAISGSLITIKGVTNIRFLVKRAHAATPAATSRWPVSTNRGQVLSPGLKQPRSKPRYNKCS